MYYIKAVLLLTLLSCLSGCSENEKERTESAFADPVIRDIYTLANRRDASGLVAYANHENAAYRTSFARVSGSVLAPELFEPLQKLLKDPIPYVRLYAAYAVGQYRDTTALPALEKAIKKATIPEIKAEV
ncbi:MAG TPA: HEAT repeat domain-containing protein, partial [Cryomorphaceae bacterium]|nr:HEAT repeat domain-containing protein [Cryomorphaceae bacterium]